MFPAFLVATLKNEGVPISLQGRGERVVRQHFAQPRHGVPRHGRRIEEAGEDPALGARGGIVRALRPDPRKGEEGDDECTHSSVSVTKKTTAALEMVVCL